MATTPNTDLPPLPIDLGPISDVDHREELERARRLAERYRLEEHVDTDAAGRQIWRGIDIVLRRQSFTNPRQLIRHGTYKATVREQAD
jgi:hypothetical protein